MICAHTPTHTHTDGSPRDTPTRELAKQISDVFVHFLPPELTHGLLIGGQDLAADVDQLNTKGWVCIGNMSVVSTCTSVCVVRGWS